MLPLVVPVIVLAVAMLVLFLAAGIERSLWTIGIGHTIVALPFVVLIVTARLAGFDRESRGGGDGPGRALSKGPCRDRFAALSRRP